ncbi:MAG: YgiT-type zinc finger protein [Candidatus Poribacteria bacterium]
MIKVKEYDYGKCDICGTHIEEKNIKQDFWIRGELIVIEDIPAGVCPQCGEKIVRAEIGQLVIRLIEDPDKIAKAHRISVPSIKFDAEELENKKVIVGV